MGNFCRKDAGDDLTHDINLGRRKQYRSEEPKARFSIPQNQPQKQLQVGLKSILAGAPTNQSFMAGQGKRLTKTDDGRRQQKLEEIYAELDQVEGVAQKYQTGDNRGKSGDAAPTPQRTLPRNFAINDGQDYDLPRQHPRALSTPNQALYSQSNYAYTQHKENTQYQYKNPTNPQRQIYPAPGTHGMNFNVKTPQNSTLVTVYCPTTFEIFQIRTNMVMSVSEFKRKIAQRYETTMDNVILSYNEKEYAGNNHRQNYNSNFRQEDESKLPLRSGLGLHEKSIVKISFKQKPSSLASRGISAKKGQRTRIHQPVQILGASLDPVIENKSKEIQKRIAENSSVRKPKNDHDSGNVIITTEQTEKMFDCNESLNETVVNEQTGILQQYFSYQEQMNSKHPQRRKKVVGTNALVNPQNFIHPTFQGIPSNLGANSYQSELHSVTPQAAQMPYSSGLFYKTGNPSQRRSSNSQTKNEVWKQAMQRLNEPSNKVAMISQVESENHRQAQSALDVRRNSRQLNHYQAAKPPEFLGTNFRPTPTNIGASQGRLDTSSFLNRLSIDNGSNNAQYQSQFQDPKFTTTVLLLTNNQNTNKTFEKTQGTTMTGTQAQQRNSNHREGSKSPVTIEIKQIGNPFLGNGGGTNQGSLNGGQNNQSFTKKSFADKFSVPPIIDQVEPVVLDVNSKPSPIIVNKNQHFKYKMRRKEEQSHAQNGIESLSQPQFIIKKSQKPLHGNSNGVVARLLSPTVAISDEQHQNFVQHHHNKSKSTLNQDRISAVHVVDSLLNPQMTPVLNGQHAYSGGHQIKNGNKYARAMAQQYGNIQSRMNQFVPNQ